MGLPTVTVGCEKYTAESFFLHFVRVTTPRPPDTELRVFFYSVMHGYIVAQTNLNFNRFLIFFENTALKVICAQKSMTYWAHTMILFMIKFLLHI